MDNRGRIGRSGPTPMRRVWFVGLVVGVVCVTALSAGWHAEHDTDPSCVVCKVRHETPSELSGDLQVGPVYAPELATRASATTRIQADPDVQVPTRAPPLT